MTRAPATAKLNLALVVGPQRDDGKHEVTTILQRIALADRISIRPSDRLHVDGFENDTLVRDALVRLADAASVTPTWSATIDKRIPVAAGLGGGSSDAATALRLANATLASSLSPDQLEDIARAIGADVPFFLRNGPQLGEGDGGILRPVDLPQDYFVVLALPTNAEKTSTRDVYGHFDARGGDDGYDERRALLIERLANVRRPRDLASLPPNDLASSPLADELRAHGAFRADVTGAGPMVYGLFLHRAPALAALRALRARGRTWVTAPAWYG